MKSKDDLQKQQLINEVLMLKVEVAQLKNQLVKEKEKQRQERLTENKYKEKALLERQKLYEVLDELPVLAYIQAKDYSIPFANRTYREIFGEPGQKRCYEVTNGRSKPCEICPTFEVFKNGKTIRGEWTDSDGRTFELYDIPYSDVDGSPLVLELGIDVTELKQTEQRLRMSEEWLYKTFDNAPVLIAILTLPDLRFKLVNEYTITMTGFSRKEIIGHSTYELGMIFDESECMLIKKLAREQQRFRNLEMHYCTKAGVVREALMSAELLVIDGEPHILAIVNDVTEMMQLERKMARLEQLNLVAEMAAGIGHEIRNPMTSVRGFLQVLSEKQDCKQYREFIEIMMDELDRANSIIDEYLSLARKKPKGLKQENLNRIINAMYPLIQASAMESNKCVTKSLHDVPDLQLNDGEIRQLILNLARNGLESMDEGGELIISTNVEQDEVILTFKDQGIGIDAEVLKRLGTPFFTTKPNGTGLGLSICYSIVERHKARIEVSTSTTGTTFYVRFTKLDSTPQT